MLTCLSVKRYTPTFSACMCLLLLFAFVDLAQSDASLFESLQTRLVKDGFNAHKLKKLFDRPQVKFETKGVYLFSKHKEAKLNYKQFTSSKSINNAKAYLKQHQQELEQAEKHYGVDKTIITAIILVETRFGRYLGDRSILNILATMAALQDRHSRNYLWQEVTSKEHKKVPKDIPSRKHFEQWANRKSKWAYSELKAFLKYVAREKIDPTTLTGSYAGAMGISQFMPSNALHLAQDGDQDGRIDLYNHADAIASIASFLKHHGWHKKIGPQKAYKVLLNYNYSKPYVKTLLKVSEMLKG